MITREPWKQSPETLILCKEPLLQAKSRLISIMSEFHHTRKNCPRLPVDLSSKWSSNWAAPLVSAISAIMNRLSFCSLLHDPRPTEKSIRSARVSVEAPRFSLSTSLKFPRTRPTITHRDRWQTGRSWRLPRNTAHFRKTTYQDGEHFMYHNLYSTATHVGFAVQTWIVNTNMYTHNTHLYIHEHTHVHTWIVNTHMYMCDMLALLRYS